MCVCRQKIIIVFFFFLIQSSPTNVYYTVSEYSCLNVGARFQRFFIRTFTAVVFYSVIKRDFPGKLVSRRDKKKKHKQKQNENEYKNDLITLRAPTPRPDRMSMHTQCVRTSSLSAGRDSLFRHLPPFFSP